MKYYLLFVISFIFLTSIAGQSNIKYCGTEMAPTYKDDIQELLSAQNNDCNYGTTSIPMALTFLMKSDQSSAYYEGLENEIMDSISSHFIPNGLHFYLVAPPVFIYEDLVYNFVIGENVEYIWPGIKSNRLNVVIAKSVSYGNGGGICGIADAYPNTVLIDYDCIPANTISHEIGHEYGLAHTHHTQFGIELVDGSNCQTAGDLICDTPADPNRGDLVNSDCTWRGTYEDENGFDIYLLDANGDKYQPDVSNLMSYYGGYGCRNDFTYQQSVLMHKSVAQKIAIYGYETTKMQFEIYDRVEMCDIGYNTSVRVLNADPNVTYQWDMDNDGTIDHTGAEAHHIYTEYGFYTIKLIMTNPDGQQFYLSKSCAINYSNEFITAPFSDDFNTLTERNYVKLIEQTPYKWNLKLHIPNGRIVAGDQVHINENSIMEYKVNLNELEHAALEFEYEFNTNTTVGGDSLLIELLNCDDEPIVLFEKWGQDLGTEGEFRLVNIQLPQVDSDVVQIRFTSKGDAQDWHNLYIDNLQVIEGDVSNTKQLTKEAINIYPNPTPHLIHINSDVDISKVELINMYGQTISTTQRNTTIDLSHVPTGVYFLKIFSNNQWYLKKVLKTN